LAPFTQYRVWREVNTVSLRLASAALPQVLEDFYHPRFKATRALQGLQQQAFGLRSLPSGGFLPVKRPLDVRLRLTSGKPHR